MKRPYSHLFFCNNTKLGLSFVEILIAILIVTSCAIPIIYMATSSRTDTVKAINYLRAVELANETIEWALTARFSDLTTSHFSAIGGTLVTANSSGLTPKRLEVTQPINSSWQQSNLMAKKIILLDAI